MIRLRIQKKDAVWVALYGAIVGAVAAVLTRLGNPVDGGFSATCFVRDIAGALGLHSVMSFSYIRPEIIGFAAGVLGISLVKRQFRPTASGSGLLLFLMGLLVAFGAFIFVGCPLRLFLRLAGGDPAALSALAGLTVGVWIGTRFLRRGFALDAPKPAPATQGLLFHGGLAVLLVLLLVRPAAVTLASGGHAPLLISLLAGAVIGLASQRGKLCFVSPIRNLFLARDVTWLVGVVALVVTVLLVNIGLGQFHPGVTIIGSSDPLWNFLGLLLVGFASTLIEGCPFRQLTLASQGNSSSAVYLLGVGAGAALAYNLNTAYSAESVETAGKIVVLAGIALLGVVAAAGSGQKGC